MAEEANWERVPTLADIEKELRKISADLKWLIVEKIKPMEETLEEVHGRIIELEENRRKKKKGKRELNVNELNELIAKQYGWRSVSVEEVDVGDKYHQWNPERKRVGFGGVLTLYLEVEEKEEGEL